MVSEAFGRGKDQKTVRRWGQVLGTDRWGVQRRSHALRSRKRPFTGLFVEPSDGLEPETPSLPLRFRGVMRVHARSSATQFLLQIEPFWCCHMRREASRVSFLMCPFSVRASLLTWATRTCRPLGPGAGWPFSPELSARSSSAPIGCSRGADSRAHSECVSFDPFSVVLSRYRRRSIRVGRRRNPWIAGRGGDR